MYVSTGEYGFDDGTTVLFDDGTTVEFGSASYRFFMRRAVPSDDGTYTVGDETDLEADFPGLRYKSADGLRDYGALKKVYTEDYAEEDGARVFMDVSSPAREQTEIALTLLFFNPSDYYDVSASSIEAVGAVYDSFVDFISGGLLVYWDTARRRKALMYLSEASEPSTDSLKGAVYMECTFTFKNKFGRTFAVDDTTIEKFLGVA